MSVIHSWSGPLPANAPDEIQPGDLRDSRAFGKPAGRQPLDPELAHDRLDGVVANDAQTQYPPPPPPRASRAGWSAVPASGMRPPSRSSAATPTEVVRVL